MPQPLPLTYVLHSGELFGTERMALATLQALRDEFQGLILAPPGPIHALARASGIASIETRGRLAVLRHLWRQLRQRPDGALCTTGVWQALAGRVLQALLRGHGAQLHVVHGGTEERLSYGRKRWLLPLGVRLVAVSDFVAERLQAHGVPAERIEVVHNFLPGQPPAQRPRFVAPGVRRVLMLSRLDRIKRVSLLFDALDAEPGLRSLQFDIYGSGEELSVLRQRALHHPNVRLHGFVPDAASALRHADLLLHTCPEEPFGLVLLEAFAAGVPVLVANAGGAGRMVKNGVNGWHFSANEPRLLAQRLLALSQMPAATLNDCVSAARASLRDEFHPARQSARYAALARASR